MITPIEKPTTEEMKDAKLLSDKCTRGQRVLVYILRRITSPTSVCLQPTRVVELHLRQDSPGTWWQRFGNRMRLDRDMEGDQA